MQVLNARNVHQALPLGIRLLQQSGERRDSRNGPVIVAPWPVTTIYERPLERVLFWPQRDANPFFHLYESLWMLAGRNDIAPLTRYVKNFENYTDDGVTQPGAYGKRWRDWFRPNVWAAGATGAPKPGTSTKDQLGIIAQRLRSNPEDRRCVLQMWDANCDLGSGSKDVPCNTVATFQRDAAGRLDLTVFCRSNDIIWGAYGANAVHFAFLLEYVALWIGCPVGVYRQVSVNWHAYADNFRELKELPRLALDGWYSVPKPIDDPYTSGAVRPLPLALDVSNIDSRIADLLVEADTGFGKRWRYSNADEPFFAVAYAVLKAHHWWKTLPAPERYRLAMDELSRADQTCDWVVAAQQWIERRRLIWERKQPAPSQARIDTGARERMIKDAQC